MEAPVARVRGAAASQPQDFAGVRIPSEARALLEALRLDGSGAGLRALDDAEWLRLLAFTDRAQLTLMLGHLRPEALPAWVRQRIAGNLSDYSKRFARLESALFEIANALEARGIEFAVLKGIAHSPEFTPDPLLRVQGDIDLWFQPESIEAARTVLAGLGYRPVQCEEHGRHLPPMVREREWHWNGDYFAPELPIAVELHYRLWDEETQAIAAPGEDGFWTRRSRSAGGLPALSTDDTLAFAALHLMMHLLHGDLRLQRAWEIANFLDRHASDEEFWRGWREHHSAPLRRLEAIIFVLVAGWFGAELSRTAEEEIEQLPDDVKLWLDRYSLSPVEALFRPNKDEIWLHLCLAGGLRERCRILLRRLAPVRRPPAGERKQRAAFVRARAVHHVRAVLPSMARGLAWWWARTGLGGGFLRFQSASALFCLGMSIFVLLYNLYLLGLGYNEAFLGRVASLMSVGTLVGALPAAALARRIGLRSTLSAAMLGGSGAALLRVVSTAPAALQASAFLGGLFMSLWAVSFSPSIAGLSRERNRQTAFSLACAAGMSFGILGGLVGGHLPGLFQHALHAGGPQQGLRAALLAAAAFAALGAWPARRLRFAESVQEKSGRVYPRGRFVPAFLAALACWTLAVGAFNPFFNVYFTSRLGMSTARLGLVYSVAQLAQVLAVLAAPLVLRRAGEVRGIAAMQLTAALALVLLAAAPLPGIAALAYAGYVSFQYMSEPGVFKMLMNRVAAGERSGASALYFLVTSIGGSVAAFAGGNAIARFGYPATLMAAAALAAVAALLFRVLIQEEACTIASPTSS